MQHASLSFLGERYLLRQPTAFDWGHGRVVSVLEALAMMREHEDDPRLRADLRAALPDADDRDPFDVLRRAMESDQLELVLDPIPRTVVLADACVPTTTALGELSEPCDVEPLVEHHATGLEDDASPELAIILFDGEGKRMGTTLDGRPIEYSITMPDGRSTTTGHLDADGVARRPIPEEGPCAIELVGLDAPDRVPTTAGPFVRVAQATLVSRRDARRPFWRNTQEMAHVFQLERRRAAVVELEHFTADGAVFLPGAAPTVLREGATRVTGLDALRTTLARAHGREPVVVCGHHPSLSLERAQSVQHLLAGQRPEWAALSVRVATRADVEAVLRWAAEELEWACDPIPGTDDDAAIREFQRAYNEAHAPTLELTGVMDEATWGAVFDVMLEQLAPPAPPPAPQRHKLVVRAVGQDPSNIYPVKMAEITWGAAQAGRAQELEADNPHICRGPWDWKPWLVPGDEIFMPASWPPEPLVAAGFQVLPVDVAPPAPRRPAPLDPVPRAIGVGERHRLTPHAEAPARRAQARHVEVILGAGVDDQAHPVCSHDGPCDSSRCWIYDPRTYDLDYVQVMTASLPVVLDFFARPLAKDDRFEHPHGLVVPAGTTIVLHAILARAQRVSIEEVDTDGSRAMLPLPAEGVLVDDGVRQLLRMELTPTRSATYHLVATNATGEQRRHRTVQVTLYAATAPAVHLVVGDDCMTLSQTPVSPPDLRLAGPLPPYVDKPFDGADFPTAHAPHLMDFRKTSTVLATISYDQFVAQLVHTAQQMDDFGYDDAIAGRRQAYADLVSWDATGRTAMITPGHHPKTKVSYGVPDPSASSCGMMLHNLLLFCGARDVQLGRPYFEAGGGLSTIRDFAGAAGLVPNQHFTAKTFYPEAGDIIYLYKSHYDKDLKKDVMDGQHIFMITECSYLGDGKFRLLSVDGGQTGKSRGRNDGFSAGIHRGERLLDTNKGLVLDDKPFNRWIRMRQLQHKFTAPVIELVRNKSNTPGLAH